MAEKQRESLLRSSISINSIRRTASQFTKSLQRSNTIARGIVKSTKERNLFERSTIAKDNEYFRKRRENIRRKQREDELEASSTTGITKREGTLTAKSTKGFLGRILDFFGIILIGWFVNRLPGILKAIGNVINLIKRATGFLTGFIDGVRDFLGTIGDGIKSALDSFPKFDFVNFKNESDKELEKAANIGQKLDQELFFATREVNDSFEKVYKDNPDLDPNTNELIYPEELEQQMRGDGEGNEQEGEGQENISNEIVSATGINFGDASNVEGMNNTVEGEEIKIADDETNKKIEEAIDKFTTTGEKIGNVDGDEQTKELGKNIEATTDGIGSGASGGSGGGGEVAAANAKSQNVETDNNKSKVDEKEEEIQEDEIVGEKGEPIINKRGRIIGYKKVDPAQVSMKEDFTIRSTDTGNERINEFNKRRNELILQKKYGGTGRPITIATPDGDKTYNPGDEGYIEAFNMISGVLRKSGAIVPISRATNNLEMTNKTDRPTIIFSGAGSSSSGSSTMSSSGGSTDIQDFKKSDNTMNKIQTLILET
tara:strand:- start:3634 stop:5262 length:1629 start_codon:yes stop_codon:yes gene_type:complete